MRVGDAVRHRPSDLGDLATKTGFHRRRCRPQYRELKNYFFRP